MAELLHIHGLSDLDRKLKGLPLRVRKNLLRKALRAGGKVIGLAARQRVPGVWVDSPPTRLLKRSNITWRVSRIRGATARVRVSWKTARRGEDKDATSAPFYARWIEFGTSRIPARPFLRPAFLASRERALEAFRRALADGIAHEVKKL